MASSLPFTTAPMKDKFDEFVLGKFNQWWDSQSWMRDAWDADFLDMLAVEHKLVTNIDTNPLELISNINKGADGWKDTTNMAIKVKPKEQAIIAQLVQAYRRAGKIPCSLAPTPQDDANEFLNQFEAQTGQIISDAMRDKVSKESSGRTKKSERLLKDKFVEAKLHGEVLEDQIHRMVGFGAVAVDSPVIKTKHSLGFDMVPSVDQNGNPTSELIPSPVYRPSTCYSVVTKFPWEVLLDSEANGDPQSGLGVFDIKFGNHLDLSKMADTPGYDSQKLLDLIEENENTDHNEGIAAFSRSERFTNNQVTRLLLNPTKPFEIKVYYGSFTRRQLEKWDKVELLQELNQNPFYRAQENFGSQFFMYEVHTVYVNDHRVYLAPLKTANLKRPISYGGMIHLPATNYFFGIYSLARPITTTMTKLIRRAVDNEIITGSSVFITDQRLVDISTVKFEPNAHWNVNFDAMQNTGKSINDVVKQITFNSVSGSLVSMFQIFDALLDEVTMIPKNLTGISTAGEQTATEVSQNLSSAQTIILSILKRFDENILVPVVESFYHQIMLDPNNPKEAISDATVVVHGAETFANMIVSKKIVMELLNILPALKSEDESIGARIDTEAIISEFLEGIGMDEMKFMRPEEEANLIMTLREQAQQAIQQSEQLLQQNQELQKKNSKLMDENGNLKITEVGLRDVAQREGKRMRTELESKQKDAAIRILKDRLKELIPEGDDEQ